MTNYVKQAVEHYMDAAGIDKLGTATTPYPPEGSLHPCDDEVEGQLKGKACSCLMKDLWASRLSRPDIHRCIIRLTTRITKWTKNDDKRLKRLAEYMNGTAESHRLKAFVCDHAEDIELWLFVDADLAGDREDSKSSTGGYVVLVGPGTWSPSLGSTLNRQPRLGPRPKLRRRR